MCDGVRLVMRGSSSATVSSSNTNGGSQGVWSQPEWVWQLRHIVDSCVVSLAVCRSEVCESVSE